MTTRTDWRRSAVRRAVLPALVALAGIVVVLSSRGVTEAIGWSVFGLGLLLLIALAFLEVGYGEDRARAAENDRGPDLTD